ncbi:hypothetical protein FACS1894122_15610 [Alphaproteobacteria bacterium]|nr:hypothetical protein FACS1894122_15610 [Alphaproteobacteria bacterium]
MEEFVEKNPDARAAAKAGKLVWQFSDDDDLYHPNMNSVLLDCEVKTGALVVDAEYAIREFNEFTLDRVEDAVRVPYSLDNFNIIVNNSDDKSDSNVGSLSDEYSDSDDGKNYDDDQDSGEDSNSDDGTDSVDETHSIADNASEGLENSSACVEQHRLPFDADGRLIFYETDYSPQGYLPVLFRYDTERIKVLLERDLSPDLTDVIMYYTQPLRGRHAETGTTSRNTLVRLVPKNGEVLYLYPNSA